MYTTFSLFDRVSVFGRKWDIFSFYLHIFSRIATYVCRHCIALLLQFTTIPTTGYNKTASQILSKKETISA